MVFSGLIVIVGLVVVLACVELEPATTQAGVLQSRAAAIDDDSDDGDLARQHRPR